ncbi:MAG: UDP-N-acetylmuramoyl-tripeptide--D-alanyl-D-alanine ligase [Candidatus Bipolaricaulota bacterium]|nr:UDP-N-acetylmuramoyl-tripeptide--D-alanyl-D-alanine ligase [Candidatus Bipolaricaulota bacterium]
MLSVDEITRSTGGTLCQPRDREVKGYSIDTRTINEGDFFIPLPGSRTDGHKFLDEAFAKGASGAIANSRNYLGDDYYNLVVVDDTEKALLQMAKFYRNSFHIPTIGVTGSWGKTTTKELISSILSIEGSVHKSPGNYNTEYGLPLAILEMDEEVEFAVFELGLQYPGDLETLSQALSPTHGLITGAGKVHLGNFSGVDEVASEKLKITKGMERNSKILINGDSSPLHRKSGGIPGFNFIKYGLENESRCKYYASDVKVLGTAGLKFSLNRSMAEGLLNDDIFPLLLETELNSAANVYNVLAAASLALELDVESSSVKQGVRFEPLPQRMQPKSFPKGTIIDDTYNANPAATRNALEYLSTLKADGKKIFVFGDMMELGDEALGLHRNLANSVMDAGVDRVLAVGEFTGALVEELSKQGDKPVSCPVAEWFESKESLVSKLGRVLEGKDNLVLVKGSRGMEMEKVVDFLTSDSSMN